MSCLFYKASSFLQDVSGWDVSNVTNMIDMFEGANLLQQFLMSNCGVSSFFDNGMSRKQRCRFFGGAFKWGRRKYFALFLVCQRYLYCSAISGAEENCGTAPCDALFDIIDLDREICKFL